MMDGGAHDGLGYHCGAGVVEVEVHVAAIGAFEGGRDFAIMRQAATGTKGRANELDVTAALFPHKTVLGIGRFVQTERTDFRIKESEGRVQHVLGQGIHSAVILLSAPKFARFFIGPCGRPPAFPRIKIRFVAV